MRDEFGWLKTNWLECVAADASLPPNATRIAVMIAMHANRTTGTARVGIDLLSKEIGVTERGARKLIGALVERRHLVIATPGGGAQRTNEYRIVLPTGYQPLLSRVASWRRDGIPIHGPKPGTCVQGFGDKNPEQAFRKPGTCVQGNPTNNPLPPIIPQNANDDDANFEWSAFEAVWQFNADDRRSAASRAFGGLSGPDRRLAIERAPAYLRRCAERGTQRRHASRWLRDQGFLDATLSRLTPLAPRHPSEPIVSERGVFIRISSPQWREWSRADGCLQALNTQFGVGCYRPTEWPWGESQ